jgi:exodeoxyribonuclease-3
VINGYFPQGESRDHPVKFPNKRHFYRDLMRLLKEAYDPNRHIMVMGDFNISPEDKDIGPRIPSILSPRLGSRSKPFER